jgi:hypothetical protein
MKPGGWPSPFLDDVLGRQLADDIRSLFAARPESHNPYGRMLCDCGNSYLGASISSVWALLVVIIAFAAGMTFQFKKKLARWILGTGVVISVLDSAIRFTLRYNRYPTDVRQMMVDGLPGQVIANIVFQFAVPFAAGLLVALFADGVRWSVGWLLRRF